MSEEKGKGKEDISFDPLVSGATFTKYGAAGKPRPCEVKISLEKHLVFWTSKKKPASKTRVAFHDIKEVREGLQTKKFGKADKGLEEKAFSIVYGGGHDTLDLVTDNKDVRDIWVGALKKLMEESKNADPITVFLLQAWEKADKNGDGKLDMEEILKLLSSLNVKLSKSQVKQTFKSVANGKDFLDFEAFIAFYKILKYRSEIKTIFEGIAKEHPNTVSKAELKAFLTQEQKMSFANDDEFTALMKKYATDKFSNEDGLSLEGFSNLLTSESPVMDPSKEKQYQDMNQPLTHYWINSSHNTYLLQDQLKGPSSVEAYVQAFQKGCRCVELDCWDGPDGRPIVFHGHTLTSKILFEDVIKTCKQYAFEVSDYPVILSLEVHTSLEQQTTMAKIMREHLGDMIVTTPLPDDAEFLPSPESLKKKFIIKGKALPKGTKADDYETDDESDDDDAPEEVKQMKEKEGKKKGAKVKVSQELSDLVTYCKTAGFKSWEESKTKQRPDQMSSFAEGKSEKLASGQREQFIEYNQRQLSRIYPAGGRVDSSNYDPHHQWNAGCQIVAFNFQTLDRPMQLNLGKYQENGGTGYLLKPEWMRKSGGAKPDPKKLTVRVISAQQLPKPGQSSKGEIIDPYVEVDICGEDEDCVSKKTKVIDDNGFNPVWNETFEFSVKSPDLTLVRFAVYDKDVNSDDFIAYGTIPFETMQPGYRHVPLRDSKNSLLKMSFLFVHITIA